MQAFVQAPFPAHQNTMNYQQQQQQQQQQYSRTTRTKPSKLKFQLKFDLQEKQAQLQQQQQQHTVVTSGKPTSASESASVSRRYSRSLVSSLKSSTLKLYAASNSNSELGSGSGSESVKAGSLCALVTPMKGNGEIDVVSLRSLLQWHLASGTDGMVILGTTGEASTMSMEERATVLKVTQEEIGGKMPIIVGCGTINPDTVIKYSKQALEYGADASLLVTPYYVKPTQKGLEEFYKKIHDAVPELPIILYNVPGRTGVDLLPKTVASIVAKCKNIIGIKEATGNVARVPELRSELKEIRPNFLLYSGDDETGAEFVLKGGDGVISVTTNIAPKEMHEMMMACLKKDESTANSINKPLELCHQKLFVEANPIPAKYALYKMGKMERGIRLPLTWMEEDNNETVNEALQTAGLI